MAYNPNYPYLTNINFTIQNVSPQRKRLTIFGAPVEYLQTVNLLRLDGVTEAVIRDSLVKGELANKIRVGAIKIVSTSILLLQFDESQKAFIDSANIDVGQPLPGTDPVTQCGPPGGGGGGYIDVTYSELTALIAANNLVKGAYYNITDFRTCYDQPDYNFNNNSIIEDNYRTSDIHPIVVLAISENALAVDAYQPDYPKDKIKYDVSWNTTEVTGGVAYGRITERVDEFNNRTDYDHRNILFKRYMTRFLEDEVLQGRISQVQSYTDPITEIIYGAVTGVGTLFNDLNVGDVVFIQSDEPRFYKIHEISSNTSMLVEGKDYYFFNQGKFSYCSTYVTPLPGNLYYFNDSGNNDIGDGGDDMYDGGNILNTNLYIVEGNYLPIPYTHTQMQGVSGEATLQDFTYDGVVENGDSYFGFESSYFTNTYPGLFVMSANNININEFSIRGDLGADGGGFKTVNKFIYQGHTIFTKCVFGAQDPSVNHIIIVNSVNNSITHTYGASTNNDDDVVSNMGSATQIHYLLFALSGGTEPTLQQLQNVYTSYLSLVSENINTTLENLNSNFGQITSNLPLNNNVCLEYKQTNIASDDGYFREVLTFDTLSNVSAINNYFGNSCDSYLDNNRDFMLPNNVFSNSYGNNIDVYDNYFNNNFVNNSFGDDVYINYFLGSNNYNNTCYDRFSRNTIKNNFNDNIFYSLEFEENIIGTYFNNNYMMQTSDFYNNNIGDSFSENRFFSFSEFNNNKIGNDFYQNKIYNLFYDNNIGNDFNDNKIYEDFYKNFIADNFYNNTIYNNFYENNFKFNCNNNTIGDSENIGGNNFYKNDMGTEIKGNWFQGETYKNTIANNFANNIIGNEFSNNFFGNDCIGNTLGNVFGYNKIANNFQDNSIEDNFGYGYGNPRGNTIGNDFISNEIGEYFYDNVIADRFYNNNVGNYFQLNNIKSNELTSSDFVQNYGVIQDYTYNAPAGTDNTYNLAASNGTGYGAQFIVTVSGSVVTDVSILDAGNEYSNEDVLIILGSQFGGTDGNDLEITITEVTDLPSVYGNYNCDIFKNSSGIFRLSYYDENDVLTIKDIDL